MAKDLKNICKNLKKYEKTDAWKELQDKIRNKKENIEQIIQTNLKEVTDYRYLVKFSMDDIELHKKSLLEDIASLIGDEVGAKEFKEFLLDLAKSKEGNILHSYITQYGYSPSEAKFTQKDMDVITLSEYRVICDEINRLSALIGSLEEKKEKEAEDIYE